MKGKKPEAHAREETASPAWACQAAVEQTAHHLQTLYWGGGSSSAEWELQVAELITSQSPHPRPSAAGNGKPELVYQWLPNCRHYLDSNWNCGGWILGRARGGVGEEWGRWGDCVFYFSHNPLGLFSWLFSPIASSAQGLSPISSSTLLLSRFSSCPSFSFICGLSVTGRYKCIA